MAKQSTKPRGRTFTAEDRAKAQEAHVFTDDEVDDIWELYFGKRRTLAQIAEKYEVRKDRIVHVIEHQQAKIEQRLADRKQGKIREHAKDIFSGVDDTA